MRIAIWGCGQLAQMLAKAGQLLGHEFVFLAEAGEDSRCVDGLGEVVTYTPGVSAQALFDQLGEPEVITVEKEMVDTRQLQALAAMTCVYPSAESIYLFQNRIREKNFLRHQGIPTAEFEVIESQKQLLSLPERFGFPIYIKAVESGYDGYHQWRIGCAEDLNQVTLSAEVPLIAEKHVAYVRELSIIAARGVDGAIAYYPLMENRHEQGVLLTTIAPAPQASPRLEASAKVYMETILSSLDYVGVLTIECFETENGLVVNELAPRVHNSGHWSIEGTQSSQFDSHCRAVTQTPLLDTQPGKVCGMMNLLGRHGQPEVLAKGQGRFYHAYGKSERPRRKLGHVTVQADTDAEVAIILEEMLECLYASSVAPQL